MNTKFAESLSGSKPLNRVICGTVVCLALGTCSMTVMFASLASINANPNGPSFLSIMSLIGSIFINAFCIVYCLHVLIIYVPWSAIARRVFSCLSDAWDFVFSSYLAWPAAVLLVIAYCALAALPVYGMAVSTKTNTDMSPSLLALIFVASLFGCVLMSAVSLMVLAAGTAFILAFVLEPNASGADGDANAEQGEKTKLTA
jgi:hypothetical protein